MSKYPGLAELMEQELEKNENRLKHYLEFKEQFKYMCESGEFHSDITPHDVQFLIDIIEDAMKL